MTTDFTDITILLDRSGSMSSIKEATIAAVNKFIADQREVPGEGCWTIAQFDDRDSARGANEQFPQILFDCVNEKDITGLSFTNFTPRGGTALVDAMCQTIIRVRERIVKKPESERPRVLIVIMTDGMENQSKEFTADRLRMLTAQTAKELNFQYLYLGANQDAIAVSKQYGAVPTSSLLAASHRADYRATNEGVEAALGVTARNVRDWKLDGNESAADLLSDVDQEKKEGK